MRSYAFQLLRCNPWRYRGSQSQSDVGQKTSLVSFLARDVPLPPGLRGSNSWLVSRGSEATAAATWKTLYNRSRRPCSLTRNGQESEERGTIYTRCHFQIRYQLTRASIRLSFPDPTLNKGGRSDRPLYTLCWATLTTLAHTTRTHEICRKADMLIWNTSRVAGQHFTRADYFVDSARLFVSPD